MNKVNESTQIWTCVGESYRTNIYGVADQKYAETLILGKNEFFNASIPQHITSVSRRDDRIIPPCYVRVLTQKTGYQKQHYLMDYILLGKQILTMQNIFHENQKNVTNDWLGLQEDGFFAKRKQIRKDVAYGITRLGSVLPIHKGAADKDLWLRNAEGVYKKVLYSNAYNDSKNCDPGAIDNAIGNIQWSRHLIARKIG